MKKKKKISTERIISVCAVILFFAAWYLVTALELVDPKLIPTPKATWDSFVEVLTQGYKGHTLLQHLGTSMERLLKAFLLSVVPKSRHLSNRLSNFTDHCRRWLTTRC